MKKTLFAALTCLTLATPAFAEDTAADIWKAKCKGCHGDDGKAETKTGKAEKMDDISTHAWQSKHSDKFIKTIITDGSKEKPKMKAYKEKLTPAEIDSLVAYVRGLKQ